MNLRYLVIGIVVFLLVIVVFGFRPFQSTVSDEPGAAPPHAINQ